MKKLLLSVAFLSATFIGANAQAISFEASEGFTLGDIRDQNGWIVTGVGGGNFTTTQVITDELSSHGDYSFRIAATPEANGQEQPVVGGFYSFTSVAFNSIEFDVYINDEGGSDYRVSLADVASEVFVASIHFDYEGNVHTISGNNTTAIVTQVGVWELATWYSVKIEMTGGQIIYSINGEVVQTDSSDGISANIDHLRFVHDNFNQQFGTGGVGYIDNIRVNGATFSVEDFASNFSVYPNPATDVINVANSADVINDVTITDLNGRTVKQITSGVNEAQINISDLAQGVYILNATSNGKSFTQKIVKQ